MDKRQKLQQAHDDHEDFLTRVVRDLWWITREGPHDDCDCYDYYCGELKVAIRNLRSHRALTPPLAVVRVRV
jgi:hypothetical protein